MSNVRSAVHGLYKKAAEAVLPPLSKSAFEEKRVRAGAPRRMPALVCVAPCAHSIVARHTHTQVLTPEEFVAAGDYLVRACPTWSW